MPGYRLTAIKRHMLISVAFVLLFALATPARAFVNIERLRWSEGGQGFSGLVDFGLDLKRGNSQITDLSASGTAGYRSGKNLIFLIGEGEYGDRGGARYLNNAMAHLRYNRSLSRFWIAEAYTQLEEDEFRLLLNRSLVGAGMRWSSNGEGLFNNAFGLSLLAEQLRYDLPANNPKRSDDALRFSGYAVLEWAFSETATLDLVAYLQPRLDDWSDLRGTSEGALRVILTERLSLTVGINLAYDSDPVGKVEPYDLSISNTLSFAF